MIRKEFSLTGDSSSCAFADDSREVLRKAGFPNADTDFFVSKIVGVLDDYSASAEEGAKVKYRIWRNLVSVEFRIVVQGKYFDPFADGKGAKNRLIDEMFSVNLNSGTPRISYKYSKNAILLPSAFPCKTNPKNSSRIRWYGA